jgi:hypothetical protein
MQVSGGEPAHYLFDLNYWEGIKRLDPYAPSSLYSSEA